MKKFAVRLLIFSIPFIFYGISIAWISWNDPFKIFKRYSSFYDTSIVDLNREYVCLQLFNNNSKKNKYDSFIFGSSRSLAYKIPEWKKYIDSSSIGFHFDATGEGIYGVFNKLNYLKKNKIKIKNALLILDYSTLTTTENRKGHLSMSPPELSGESRFSYYKEYLSATSDLNFIKEYCQYSLFNKYNANNKYIFPNLKNNVKSNDITGDIFFASEMKILDDKKSYYSKKINEGVFYDRKVIVDNEKPISNEEKFLLEKISEVFKSENTNYKIVISPLYNQKVLGKERKNLLISVFGKKNVFDFSGKNKFTNSIYNYYESSHYLPKVANEIMDIVYNNDIK
jgi:hypothetical protein